MKENKFDLLSTVEYGGCSAKLPAGELSKLLSAIPLLKDENIMVDVETHDDAGVYRINDDLALIVTTDFFPPICSDPYMFGQIAAANSLSDVYAMGGTPLLVLNINMFPSTKAPLEVLRDILLGGQDKINESGAFTMGGHTIDDAVPKYGLAVVGTIHPDKLVTNSGAKVSQKLILTKPIGSGVLVSAHRMGMADEGAYNEALSNMLLLNKQGAKRMVEYGVTGATDITGFGLLGHAIKMAQASGVTIEIDHTAIPLLPQVYDLIEEGCVPGAVFRNMEYVKDDTFYSPTSDMSVKLASLDAQTSGGLLMSVDADKVEELLSHLKQEGYPCSSVIGECVDASDKYIRFL